MTKVPKIVEPREMNLWEAVAWAMEGQTRIIDAQVRICIWETERIVKRARAHSTWDTCFHRCLWELQRSWEKRPVPQTETACGEKE